MTTREKSGDWTTDTLTEIKTKLDILCKQFDQATVGVGFSRCVEHAERIIQLQKDVSELKKSKTAFDMWLMRLTWLTVIGSVLKVAFFPDL